MVEKNIPNIILNLVFILFLLNMVSANELTVTSVSPVNIIKNEDSVSGEILVDTTINGGGQSFMATLNPQDVRNFQSYGSDKPYPANSIQLEVNSFEEYVFYNIVNNHLGVYEYQNNQNDEKICQTTLGVCNSDAPPCSNGAEWELREKSTFGYIEIRDCIKKQQIAVLGDFGSSVIKFNANVKVSSGTNSKSKTISSGNEGQNSIDLGEAGIAIWTGSKISGISIPSVNNYLPLLQDGASNWKVISNQKKLDYEYAKNDIESFLNQHNNVMNSGNTFDTLKSQLTTKLSDTNNKVNYLVNDVASLDYSYSGGAQQGIIITLTNRVTLPEILFRLKASWIGIIIPSGQPRITSVNADKFFSGQTGTIEVAVENVGEANGVFSVRLVNCEPFIVPETSISSRTNVAKGSRETIGIPISSGTLSEEYSRSCSIEVYDINEPSHKDSAPLTLELGTAKICEPNKIFVDGNVIKKCDNRGKNIEILKECLEGVKLYENKGWDCVGEGITKEGTSKSESFCSEDWECGRFAFCSQEIHACVQKSGCLNVIENGDSNDKADFLFIGAEFSDLEELKNTISELLDLNGNTKYPGLFSVEPFKSNKDKFNIWMIKAPDYSVLDSNSCSTSCSKAIDFSQDSIYSSQCPNADFTITIFKKSKFRSCAGGGQWSSLSCEVPSERGKLILHETGHSFGRLADEYVEKGKESRPWGPNCADTLIEAQQLWGDLDGVKGTGYYPGCSYTDDNYRSTKDSFMNLHWMADSYGPVNERAIKKIIDGYK